MQKGAVLTGVALLLGGGNGGCDSQDVSAGGATGALPSSPAVFVSPLEVAPFLGRKDVVFLDARLRLLPLAGRIPGSRPSPWTDFTDPGVPGPTGLLDPDDARLGKKLGALGITPDAWVVVYGDSLSGWGEDGRIGWMLEALGHPRTSILDGGLVAWKEAGLPISRWGTGHPEPSPPLPIQRQEESSATRQEILRTLTTPSPRPLLVDSRTPEEYQGATPHGESRGGHLPGALSYEFKNVLDAKGVLRPEEELVREFAAMGLEKDRPIIAYCTGGVRSGHAFMVLKHLGFSQVKNYPGSFWEWSKDPSLPIEK